MTTDAWFTKASLRIDPDSLKQFFARHGDSLADHAKA